MKNEHPTLVERCRQWIYKNVPRHTQAEYEALLLCNEQLMVRLISKCIDFEALLEAHYKLQDEVARTYPKAPFVVKADVFQDTAYRKTVAQIDWRMDPMRACVSVMDMDSLAMRFESRAIRDAMKEHFEREVAPNLWKLSEYCLEKSLARVAV